MIVPGTKILLTIGGLALLALGGCCYLENEGSKAKSPCLPSYTYREFKPRNQTIEEYYPIPEAPSAIKVTSGGRAFVTEDGRLLTLQGSLEANDRWHILYQKNSDTLFGRRPQNIFRALIDTCLLASAPGFFLETRVMATDFEPPSPLPYQGGFDLIAQWWSPQNQNAAFLCREDYGGFCGNVGYHAKIQQGGGFEIARERPTDDRVVATRYTTLDRADKALALDGEGRFPLGQTMRLRLEVKQTGPSTVILTACFDGNDDGVWDRTVKSNDEARSITGQFVPIIRSDWFSAEFSNPNFGPLAIDQESCAK